MKLQALIVSVQVSLAFSIIVQGVEADTTDNMGTGRVSLKPFCSLARPSSGGGARINCLVDSKDPEGSVHWSLITQDGQTQDLGRCEGLTGPCLSPLGPEDVRLTRWYSWTVVTLANMQERVGDTLVCSATHLGNTESDRCLLGGLNRFSDFPDCTVGESECRDLGMHNVIGRLKDDVICCPDGQAFVINLSDRDHTCRCNTDSGQ